MPLRGIVVALIIAAIVLVTGLIVLGLVGDFLVDWAWFSAVGYLPVFWTVLGAKAAVFLAAFGLSGVFLWLNGLVASRVSGRHPRAHAAGFDWQSVRGRTVAEALKLLPVHLWWPLLVAALARILGALISAAGGGHLDGRLAVFFPLSSTTS